MAKHLRAIASRLQQAPQSHVFSTLNRRRAQIGDTASRPVLNSVLVIPCDYNDLSVEEFRKEAFNPEKPALITKSLNGTNETSRDYSLPAISKWFTAEPETHDGKVTVYHYGINKSYFEDFRSTIVPYELLRPQLDLSDGGDVVEKFREMLENKRHSELADYIPQDTSLLMTQEIFISGRLPRIQSEPNFHQFYAPLDLFLHAAQHGSFRHEATNHSEPPSLQLPCLYIAQAQLSDLPSRLREDLPTPRLVKEAGRGDIYDSNLWLGTPPTYTPLHKDPNPNLFIQIASNKIVRLFAPGVGSSIFNAVRRSIGSQTSPTFRGEEMMQGAERRALEEAVWHSPPKVEGFEVIVRPGDALFIPKGWWHSIKSLGMDVTASVNWWFR